MAKLEGVNIWALRVVHDQANQKNSIPKPGDLVSDINHPSSLGTYVGSDTKGQANVLWTKAPSRITMPFVQAKVPPLRARDIVSIQPMTEKQYIVNEYDTKVFNRPHEPMFKINAIVNERDISKDVLDHLAKDGANIMVHHNDGHGITFDIEYTTSDEELVNEWQESKR
jgi:hypothetical protein